MPSQSHAFFLFQGHAEIVRFLVNVCSLEVVDDYGITPLFVAAQYGHQHCLEILANAGEVVFQRFPQLLMIILLFTGLCLLLLFIYFITIIILHDTRVYSYIELLYRSAAKGRASGNKQRGLQNYNCRCSSMQA